MLEPRDNDNSNFDITEAMYKKLGSELIGFEYLIDQIIKVRTNANYPPFNIEMINNDFKITIAVAGFTSDELDITLDHMNLSIKGAKKQNTEQHTSFIHRGIATRSFQKSFLLAEGMIVSAVDLSNGLLEILIKKPSIIVESVPIPIGYRHK
jgi:HSP20 family molecular chaperone IbpA